MSEAAAGGGRRLPSIFPGSWINGDFYIWAGHRDDHRAWGQLAAARAAFDCAGGSVAEDARVRALEELLIAEGSDWFWWYGDDHSSEHDSVFDDLFRRHLRNVYRALGQRAPDDLHLTNISTASRSGGPVRLALATPDGDNPAVDFRAWALAAAVPVGHAGGTMHRVSEGLLEGLRLVADERAVYLRLEGARLADRAAAGDVKFELMVDGPHPVRVGFDERHGAEPVVAPRQSVMLAAPLASMNARPGDRVRLVVMITDAGGHVLEQFPGHDPLEVVLPSRDSAAIDWVV
jgi:hypothetical protein